MDVTILKVVLVEINNPHNCRRSAVEREIRDWNRVLLFQSDVVTASVRQGGAVVTKSFGKLWHTVFPFWSLFPLPDTGSTNILWQSVTYGFNLLVFPPSRRKRGQAGKTVCHVFLEDVVTAVDRQRGEGSRGKPCEKHDILKDILVFFYLERDKLLHLKISLLSLGFANKYAAVFIIGKWTSRSIGQSGVAILIASSNFFSLEL